MESAVVSTTEASAAAASVQPRGPKEFKFAFVDGQEIINALRRVPEVYDPRSTSVLTVRRGGRNGDPNPFRRGFIDDFEERAELMRLLQLLDDRSRMLLVFWFVDGLPVVAISRRLHVSRVHCYRLRDRALRTMLEVARSEEDLDR